MPFFITFRSARKKLHVTVFFDHPVLVMVDEDVYGNNRNAECIGGLDFS